MARQTRRQSVMWSGKNLAEVRKLHRKVKHYPAKARDDFPRDYTQHPDHLHVETEEGHTLVLAPGDQLVKEDGKISVKRGSNPPTPNQQYVSTVAFFARHAMQAGGWLDREQATSSKAPARKRTRSKPATATAQTKSNGGSDVSTD
jgi:hypothetical protein